MERIGIYIHIPFCVSKCIYCNFNSYANKNHLIHDYISALIQEIEMYGNHEMCIDTVFIGGGTPSILPSGAINTIITSIRKNFRVDTNAEITIEANPNSISLPKAREWKESGINRVSVGLQSANDNLLKLLGRAHVREDYIRAVDIIKSVGINNINTDCLIGLPRQKMTDVKFTLSLITKLNIPHCSVYSLILEEETKLYDLVELGELKLPKEERTLDMYNYACSYLEDNGLNRYEVSNFAKSGYECKHNLNTWNMHHYFGFGAGAHGYIGNIRYSNITFIEEYISSIQNNKKPVSNSEEISDLEKFEETIMLGLRTREGLDLHKMIEDFGIDILSSKKDKIDYLLSNNLINIENNRLFATNLGFTVLNKIILELVT